uniref:large ribosomal subunit protein uL10m n=1 Tax=Myxine glutinosa TaxID=7769 RepID=UPI00358F5772
MRFAPNMAASRAILVSCFGRAWPMQPVRYRARSVTRHWRAMSPLRMKVLAITKYIPPKPVIPECCVKPMETFTTEKSKLEQLLEAKVEDAFRESTMIAVFQNCSLKMKELFLLQHKLKKHGIVIHAFGSKMVHTVLKDTKFHNLLPLFLGTNYVMTSKEAKVKELLRAIKAFPQIVLLGGCVGNRLLSIQGLKACAELPRMEDLQAQFLGTTAQLGQKTTSLLQWPLVEFSYMLQQHVQMQEAMVAPHTRDSTSNNASSETYATKSDSEESSP